MESKLARVLVSGRVQGVFFRWFVKDAARSLKLVGTVRNLKDGDVEAFIEGDEGTVTKLIETIRQGNRASRVDDLVVEWSPPSNGFSSFKILTGGK